MKKLSYILIMALLAGCAKAPEVSQTAAVNSVSSVATPQTGAENDLNIEAPTVDEGILPTKNGSAVKEDNSSDGYFFIYNNTEIKINTKIDETIEALGDYQNYFEAPSCAFEGIDKTYFYNGIEITTYPKDGDDYIFSVAIVDDNNKTPEGIYLGAPVSELITAYGDGYEKDMGLYVYQKGGVKLLFLTENDIVVSISYEMVLDD